MFDNQSLGPNSILQQTANQLSQNTLQTNSQQTLPSKQQQPRFIRKKPQVIHSIEFSQELKTSELVQPTNDNGQTLNFGEDEELRLAHPQILDQDLFSLGGHKQQEQSEEDSIREDEQEGELQKMMNDLKMKKHVDLQQQAEINKSYNKAVSSRIEEIAHSFKTHEVRTLKAPQMSLSPEQRISQKRRSGDHKVSENFEDLKQKKLEELTLMMVNSRLVVPAKKETPPYMTTVSKIEEEEYKSESTVQYMNDSGPETSQYRSLAKTRPLKQSTPPKVSKEQTVQAVKNMQRAQVNTKQPVVKESRTPIKNKDQVSKQDIGGRNTPNKLTTNQSMKQLVQNRNLTPNRMNVLQESQNIKVNERTPVQERRVCDDLTPPSQRTGVQQLLSEKTQQIFFKKLQKDTEMAIRKADINGKGALTMEELKQCLFHLDYLSFMQVDEGIQSIPQAYQRNHTTTSKSMIMQEKEFLYNFWCIMNPLTLRELDNALLYDSLLLLIYNVQQPLHQTTLFLTEYLENLYRELGIQIDSFANFNSGSSLGVNQSSGLSNLSKYLAYNNIWSIEKLSIEFRQIHANKLGHLFSSSKRQQVSPNSIPSTQSIMINPSDGRRYKKLIVEDHLQHLTFSPSIGSKSNRIDSQLTQKWRKDQNKGSATDHLSSFFDYIDPNLREHDINTIENEPTCSSFRRYDLLIYRKMIADEKIEKAKENKLYTQLKECTFQPNVVRNQPLTLSSSKSYQNLYKQTNQVFTDITSKIKQQRTKILEHTASTKPQQFLQTQAVIDKGLEECTFKPNTTKKTPRDTSSAGLPKGYYEMINRIRKVTEEKRALEDKLQKKAVGENYDKLKLMNIKPPSFIQGIDNKRKKRNLLMYVDVNITPTKTGRIGIYEGDDVTELARNFQRTFQLNKTMLTLLTQQLEQHLNAYKLNHDLADVEGTIFPETQLKLVETLEPIRSMMSQSSLEDRQLPPNFDEQDQSQSDSDEHISFPVSTNQPRFTFKAQTEPFKHFQQLQSQFIVDEDEQDQTLDMEATAFRRDHQTLDLSTEGIFRKISQRKQDGEKGSYFGNSSEINQFALKHNNESFY